MFLIVIDSYSKWLEVIPTSTANSKETIKIVRSIFATHGLPEQCVTDNGSPFTSIEFESFLQQNGIKQIRTSPYHPSSNGMAERMVQTFKNSMEKMKENKGDLSEKLQRWLFTYRITPQTTTGRTPSELLTGRKLASALDLLKPNVGRHVREHQSQMVKNSSKRHKKELEIGNKVYIRNFGQGSYWLKGVIVNRHGPLTWLVRMNEGNRIIQRHANHIRKCHDYENDGSGDDISMPENALEQPVIEPTESMRDIQPHLESNIDIPTDTMPSIPLIPSVSRSNNATIRKPPDYFKFTQ